MLILVKRKNGRILTQEDGGICVVKSHMCYRYSNMKKWTKKDKFIKSIPLDIDMKAYGLDLIFKTQLFKLLNINLSHLG